MQLLELEIKNYKNLKDFTWEIGVKNASSALVILGKNASGKTNVLEAIIQIFDFLIHSKKRKAPFGFKITYKIEVVKVSITCDKNQLLNEVIIDDKKVAADEIRIINKTFKVPFSYTNLDNLIPENIILYYSGFSNRFRSLSDKFKQEYSTVFRKQKAVSLPPIISLEPIHCKMILLALFSFDKSAPIWTDFFLKYFKIESLSSFEIHLKKHTGWIMDHSFEDFFNTNGIVRNFIQQLHLLQDELKEREELPIFVRSKKNSERINKVIYKFKNNKALLRLKEVFGYEDDVFKILNILYTTKNLAQINLKVKKEGLETPISFESLSEGEVQFLAIKGMIYILQGKNSLFLWDEPDTFLNPSWQWDLIPGLEREESEIQRDQFIITTHSPVLLSTVKKQAYFIDEGSISVLKGTYGLTVDESLIKQNLNVRIEEFEKMRKEYFNLIENRKFDTAAAKELRGNLEKILGAEHEELQRADVLISFYQ